MAGNGQGVKNTKWPAVPYSGVPNEHFSQNWLYDVVNASRVLLRQPMLIFNFPGKKNTRSFTASQQNWPSPRGSKEGKFWRVPLPSHEESSLFLLLSRQNFPWTRTSSEPARRPDNHRGDSLYSNCSDKFIFVHGIQFLLSSTCKIHTRPFYPVYSCVFPFQTTWW